MHTSIREINHPLGSSLKTPLLIPSFSSKGFESYGKKSELKYYIELSKQFITESILISAYDFHYNLVPAAKNLNFSNFIFIDSGGYEISNFRDFSEIKKTPPPTLEWNEKLHFDTLNKWPEDFTAVIVSFDSDKKRYNVNKQIKLAQSLFEKFPSQLNDFLIKPEKKSERMINFVNVIDNAKEYENFDIIGFAEKELGDSMLQRMINIAKLRKEFDRLKFDIPVHIFGCLDPISCLLYYAAGADIFDGLTWLRYSYYNGMTIYVRNYNIMSSDVGIHSSDEKVIAKSITKNIYYLEELKFKMLDFHKSNNLSEFNGFFSEEVIKVLNERINSFIKIEV